MKIEKTISLILFLSLCLVLFAQQVTKEIPAKVNSYKNPFVSTNTKALEQGEKIYRKQCMVCHGETGLGDGPYAITMRNKPASFKDDIVMNRTDGALFWWILEGGNDMKPYKDVLEEEDIWKLVLYTRKLQGN